MSPDGTNSPGSIVTTLGDWPGSPSPVTVSEGAAGELLQATASTPPTSKVRSARVRPRFALIGATSIPTMSGPVLMEPSFRLALADSYPIMV